MRSWKSRVTRLGGALLGSVLVSAAATPALADMYTWRTEDGGYAYTDDPKQIPARYRAQAKRIERQPLTSYARYTPQDPDASARYAERLERRLAALRDANEMAREIERERAAVEQPAQSVVMSAGGPYAPQITANVTDDAPMVVEPVLIRETGDTRTRRATVIRQGGKVIALLKDSQHNYNVSEDILDEAELEAGGER